MNLDNTNTHLNYYVIIIMNIITFTQAEHVKKV